MTRSVGILMSRFNLDTEARTLLNPASAAVGCAAIWALAFAIISPTAFSLTIGPYYFNEVTDYEIVKNGICKPLERDNQNRSVGLYSGLFLYNVAIYIPFIFTLVSYIFISIVLEVEKRRKQRILKSQTQVPVRQIQWTLVALSSSVILFGLPLNIVDNIFIGIEEKFTDRTESAVALGWYLWMYAINVILYVTTLKDYRMMFRQVLKGFSEKTRKDNVDPTLTSNVSSSSIFYI